MALGWGAPGKGLIMVDSGWVRTVEDVFITPERGTDKHLPNFDNTSLRAVALDQQGRRAVALGTNNTLWITNDSGQSWQKQPSAQGGRLVAYWPGRGSFVVVSDRTVREISFGSGRVSKVDISDEAMWNESKTTDSVATITFEESSGGFLLTTYAGEAIYWQQRRPTDNSSTTANSYASLPVSLFEPGVRAITLAF